MVKVYLSSVINYCRYFTKLKVDLLCDRLIRFVGNYKS